MNSEGVTVDVGARTADAPVLQPGLELAEEAEEEAKVQVAVQQVTLQQLRELDAHRIIRRKVYRQVPPKVEYSLTPLGESLKPVLDAMHQWGERYPNGVTDKKRNSARRGLFDRFAGS